MNYILKIFLFFVLLVSVLILMSTYFINIFFVNEEIINLPKLYPEKTSEKISPIKNKFKNKDIDMQILIEKEEIKKNKRIILKEVEPEPIPFDLNNNTLNSEKTSKDNKKISGNLYKKLKKNSLLNKKLKNENGAEKIDLNKFRVQLGSFKNKNRAKKAIKDLNLNIPNLFQKYKLELYTLRKGNYYIHRVWTTLMNKKQALDLCDRLKKRKINCILQIDKS